MSDLISIVVVDDHPLFREGVVMTLMESGKFNVIAQAGSKDDAIIVAQNHMPDMMLVDVSMPGGGIETAVELAKRTPAIKVVMLTVSEQAQDVQAALKAQARGFILKGVGINDGESYITPNLATNLLMRNKEVEQQDTPEKFDLSKREIQILEKLAVGMSNRDIAEEIKLSEKTVKHYMTNIMNKLRVSNRVQAAIKAHEMAKNR